jgi:peptidoglycan LD-endopeptidase CwlK
MSRLFDDLDLYFKPKAIELVARCAESGIPVMIVCTRRSQEEQDAAIASGHSWVTRSKHQDGLAIDVCPFEEYKLYGPDKLEWDNDAPAWQVIGSLGEHLGLRWGGRWQKKDMGHFEWP